MDIIEELKKMIAESKPNDNVIVIDFDKNPAKDTLSYLSKTLQIIWNKSLYKHERRNNQNQ